MHRRQLLKLILPAALVSVGGVGAVLGRKLFLKQSCEVMSLPELIKHLQPFSDANLGKNSYLEVKAEVLKRFNGFCEDDFAKRYQQLVSDDFSQGKTMMVDGWIISETEAITHRLVYQGSL